MVGASALNHFRVIGNIYNVGAKGLSSYLVITPEGHILLDTGINEMHDVIRANIETLGFKLEDVKFMVSRHAHWDHEALPIPSRSLRRSKPPMRLASYVAI